jgi:hypothetical protein
MERSWPESWVLTLLCTAPLPAAPQSLPAATTQQVAAAGAPEPLRYVVQLPAGFLAEQRWPLLLLLADGTDLAAAQAAVEQVGAEIARGGFVVVSPAALDAPRIAALLGQLRQTFRIDQGGMHAGGAGTGGKRAAELVAAHRHEFQTLTVWGGATDDDLAPVRGLRERRVQVLGAASGADLRQHFTALHAVRALTGAAADVARTLDELHDAAATGDEARYFAILPDDAVFLGTDATERWTGAQFRAFAMPYFERGPAWTYVPLRRWVTIAADGAHAWFDEVLDNAGYGECRGSGVLELRGERWVVRQYNLTVPVPNDLLRGVAARIRAFEAGKAPVGTTIVVVRHAEKLAEGDDPELSDAGRARAEALAKVLRSVPVSACYTSQYRRTAATVAPLCRERRIRTVALPAQDAKALAARLRAEHAGETVVVCGHSNTVPPLLAALGIAEKVAIGDDEYDGLYVVSLGPDGARLLKLHYAPRD